MIQSVRCKLPDYIAIIISIARAMFIGFGAKLATATL